MKRLLGLVVLMTVAGCCLIGAIYAADDEKKTDASRSTAGFETVANSFENKGPFGAVVKVGHDKTTSGTRFGAAAHIGVSSDSYGKYRFAIYVTAKNEAGEVVEKHASVMAKEFEKKDSHQWVVWNTHEKAKPGTYTVTAVLTAIAKDGSVTILDQGKTTTYVVK